MRTKYSNDLTKYPSVYESASVSGSAAYIRAEMGVESICACKGSLYQANET